MSGKGRQSRKVLKLGVRIPRASSKRRTHALRRSRGSKKSVKSCPEVCTLEQNVQEFGFSAQRFWCSKTVAGSIGLTYFGMEDKRQGIVHVIGPEQGFTLPGTTVVCGDSHTSTHGAFGSLAFGIGTSEVEHVLATQTLLMKKAKNMPGAKATRGFGLPCEADQGVRQAHGGRDVQGCDPFHHRHHRYGRRHGLRGGVLR